MTAPIANAADPAQPSFEKDWNEEIGLWKGNQKSASKHSTVRNSTLLAQAGLLGKLKEVPAERVLGMLRKSQEKKNAYLRGNFWRYWEDKKVSDRNMGFFVTLNLLVLHYECRNQLNAKSLAHLDHMLKEAENWFQNKIVPVKAKSIRYPNAFMGDAICLWLLRENAGKIDAKWRKVFKGILAYYRDREWGWGEHLSDLYGRICERELAALLMWSKKLDPETRAIAKSLLEELVTIDHAFAGGPRVPTIRCYWLDKSPGESSVPLHPTLILPAEYKKTGSPLSYLGAKRGVFSGYDLPAYDSPARSFDCYDRTSQSQSWVTKRYRYGTLTRYPLFPDTNEASWGLAWQSMPTAFWHTGGDWGYLQWLTEEKGSVHAHPGITRELSQGEKRCRLSHTDPRAAYGLTRGVRHHDSLLVYREMARFAKAWPWVIDRFRLVEPTAKKKPVVTVNGWTRLALGYEEEVVTVACRSLNGKPKIALSEADGEWHFGAKLDLGKKRPGNWKLLWFITAGKEAATPPAIDHKKDLLCATFGADAEYAYTDKGGWKIVNER